MSDQVLLDTCVIIDLEQVEVGDLAGGDAAVSAVTIAEPANGLDTDDPIERPARTERYCAVMDQLDVVQFDTAAAKRYGTRASLTRRMERNPGPRRPALQIETTAVTHSFPLITRNAADFAGLTSCSR